jgi:hypothetical protein
MEQGQSPHPAPGSHARRRLAWLAAIAGGLLVVGGAIHLVTRFGDSSTPHQPRASVTGNPPTNPRLRYGEMDLQIAYGTTPRQVLRQLGSPTTRQADCWIYRGQPGRIRGRYSGQGIDGMKFCFSAGGAGNTVVTQIFNHVPAHTNIDTDPVTHTITKTHYPAQWLHAFTMLKVPDWYLQQSS